MSDQDHLVSVYKAANVTEAHLVLNLLLEEGIQAAVSEENEPLAGLPIVPPDILVHQRDLSRAQEIVAAYQEEQFERVDSGEAFEEYEEDDDSAEPQDEDE